MKITKRVLDRMEHCYCASSLTMDGQSWAILAGEDQGAPCYAYRAPDFTEKEVIWEAVGGTMSLIQIPGSNGEFLAVQNFFPVFQSEEAKIVWGRRENGRWLTWDVLSLPFVHRFDILESDGVKYFFAATLCTSKKEVEDWSDPGALYACELSGDLSGGMTVTPLLTGLTRNHGYCRGTWRGRQAAFTSCDSGVYVSLPPEHRGGSWTVEHIMERPISDIALCDIDGDGEDELATIEPFHGNQFHIYKQRGGIWERIYTYDRPIEFAHAVWGGSLLGRPGFLLGVRRMDCELVLVRFDREQGRFVPTMIDRGAGSSNVAVFSLPGKEVLVAANHTPNEAVVYLLEE